MKKAIEALQQLIYIDIQKFRGVYEMTDLREWLQGGFQELRFRGSGSKLRVRAQAQYQRSSGR